MNNRPFLNIVFGISVGGIIILAVLLFGITNDLRINLNEVKNGEVYAKTITKDKLADDVFNTIELELEDGSVTSAQLIKANIKNGELTESLEFQTEDGEIYTAKVLGGGTGGDVTNIISSTSDGLSTIVVNYNGETTNTNLEIADGSILTVKLANGAVTTEKLADGSVGTLKILDGSITSSKLTEGVILTQHLANAAVTSFKIADNAITTSKLLDNIITSEKLVSDSVTAPKIANGAVTSIKLGDGSVTALKIVDGNVTEGKLADGSVTAFKLGDNAVITAKILDGNITEAKLASGSITLSKLSTAMCADGEVLQKNSGVWNCTSLAPGGVTSVTAGAGLNNSGTATDPILDANVDDVTIEIVGDVLQIKDGAITNSKLATDSVTSDKIDDGTITNDDIAAGAAIAWTKLSKTGSSLADLATRNAGDLNIADSGNYFTATNAEGALQEVGSALDTINTDLGLAFVNGGNAFGGAATLGTTDANSLAFITNSATAITILDGGNVGIGATSPTAKLSIESDNGWAELNFLKTGGGSFVANVNSASSLSMESTGTTFSIQTRNSGDITINPDHDGNNGLLYLGSTGQSDITRVYGQLDIQEGNLGIGTTSPTLASLQILRNNSSTSGVGHLSLDVASGALSRISVVNFRGTLGSGADTTAYNSGFITSGYSGAGFDTSYLQFIVNNVGGSSVNAMRITNGGNVGIGTTSPNTNLSIYNPNENTTLTNFTQALANAGLNIVTDYTASSYTPGIFWSTQDNNGTLPKSGVWTQNTINGSNIIMGTTNSYSTGINNTAFAINHLGNVGIGDTTPASLFTVGNGDLFQVNSSGNIVALGGAAHSIANSSGALNIDSATTGAINIGTSANAKTITMGNTTGATALTFNSGTGVQTFNSSATTGNAFAFHSNSLSSGNGLSILSTSTALTSGNLANLYWNPGSATTSTGSLLSLDVGANGTLGYILNVKNNGSTVFGVSQSQISANLPVAFNSPGDVAVAYDLFLTNPTASYLKSNSNIYIQAGEVFNSSNLTLKTYNSGLIHLDSSTLAIGITGCSSGLQTNASGYVSCISSDQNLKDNITTLSSSLQKVMGLRGVSYNWKDKSTYGSQTEYGLIAQEVEAIAPELVFTMGNGVKGVKYQQLTGLLIEAIKEQQGQILALQAQAGNLSSGATVITTDNILQYFNNNVIPHIKVKKITINEQVIAQSVKVIGDTQFYGKAEFNDQVALRNKINVGNDTAGKAKIVVGQSKVSIQFGSEYSEAPIVTISPTELLNEVSYAVTNITKSGFDIEISSTLNNDIEFNWIVVGIGSGDPVSYPGN